jgi:hypothetical protein
MIGNNQGTEENSSPSRSIHDLIVSSIALVCGLLIGWLDLQTTEAIVTILALLIVGLLTGLLQPVGAWRWALFLVVGLPMMEAVALLGNWQTAEPVRLDLRIVLVALAFAMVGCYFGVLIRHTVRVVRSRAG